MPVVTTGLLSAPVPGIWQRLSLISSDGTLSGFRDAELVGQFEELGIPRHQLQLAHLLQSWQQARVPPDVAFALWLLRQQHTTFGCLYRRAHIRVEESSPAIRYVQLASALGESRDSDPTLHDMVQWLLDHQLPDGSIPLIVAAGHGETGQTSRTLRALHGLHDPALHDHLERMAAYLMRSARTQPTGVAWSYSEGEKTAVTGSTSLAVTALLEFGEHAGPVVEGLRFLLDSQDPSGGWAEVPGYQPTLQQAFTAVRALRATAEVDLPDLDVEPALARARRWFLGSIERQPPRSVLELAFALRLAAVFGDLRTGRVESLALQLGQRRRETLHARADMYADTELAAISLLECSRELDRTPDAIGAWSWRWKLPRVPPPFLATEGYFYELLYSVLRRRWWVRFVDRLVSAKMVEHTASLLLGTIVAFGVVNEELTTAFLMPSLDARRSVALVLVTGLLLAWLAVKAAARTLVSVPVWTTLAALVIAIASTWIRADSTPLVPDLLAITAIQWLIIDAVAFTADRTGLLNQLLPKG